MREMSIESIRLSLMNYQRVVILRERDADRYLPIWIGPAEAEAIAVRLQDVAVARPLTHDLLRNTIEQMGGKVSYILVNGLENDTFFATIVLDVNGQTMEIDSRPSDAIALAVRVEAPIFAEESVLDVQACSSTKRTRTAMIAIRKVPARSIPRNSNGSVRLKISSKVSTFLTSIHRVNKQYEATKTAAFSLAHFVTISDDALGQGAVTLGGDGARLGGAYGTPDGHRVVFRHLHHCWAPGWPLDRW